MIELSIKKPITMLMVIATFVIFGIYTFRMMAIDLFPDVDLPVAALSIVYPGAGPDEIETSVVKQIEDEISLIDGLKKIEITVIEGAAVFLIEFESGIDIDIATIDIKDKVDLLKSSLPDNILDPVISKVDLGAMPVITLSVTGPDSPARIRYNVDEILQPQLSRISGVAKVSVVGGLEREIHVDVNSTEIDARGIPLTSIYQIIAANNLNYPLGDIDGRFKKTTIRLDGEFTSLEELRELEIPTATGLIKLKDVANVHDSHKEVTQKAYYNGENSVGLSIIKKSGSNVVEMANTIIDKLPKIQKLLPQGYKIDLVQNTAEFAENSYNDTFNNIYLGIVLTALILFMFLGNFSSTLIAAITMPSTIVMAFTLLYANGYTLNVMTLMALGLSVGLLVTNTIVVLENIMKHLKKKGDDPKKAALKGTREIAMAVAASTLTNMAVFVPLAFMDGVVGQMFQQFGLTMVFATIMSLIISFTLTPMMASRLLKQKKNTVGKESKPKKTSFIVKAENLYRKILVKAVSPMGLIIVIATIIIMFISMVVVAGMLGSEFIPKSDQGSLDIKIELPSGTKLSATEEVTLDVYKRLTKLEEIENVYVKIGGANPLEGGTNIAALIVKMVDKSKRDLSTNEISSNLNSLLADIPSAKISISPTITTPGPPSSGDLIVKLTASNRSDLILANDTIKSIMSHLKGAVSTTSSWKEGAPELILKPRQNVLAEYGMTSGQIAQLIRMYVVGQEASIYRENNEEYDILVKLPDSEQKNISDILGMSVPTPRGIMPLSALVESKNSTGPAILNRLAKKPLITIGVFLAPGVTAGDAQKEFEEKTKNITLPGDTQISYGGDTEMMQETMIQMVTAMLLAIILTYVLLTALLESFIQPLTIMMTIPLGAIGVMWSLFITGQSISMVAMMAMVMLIGIVVNNAILIMDFANYLSRKKNMTPKDAAIEGAASKFRAILMTNIATIVSMLPLAFALGEGAEMRQPMAIASIGGLIVSTIITVIFIPQLYWAIPTIKDYLSKKLGRKNKSYEVENN